MRSAPSSRQVSARAEALIVINLLLFYIVLYFQSHWGRVASGINTVSAETSLAVIRRKKLDFRFLN